jgi:hypothetical protein
VRADEHFQVWYRPCSLDLAMRLTGLKILRPEVESVVRIAGVVVTLSMLVLPAAWGYQQRAEARAWREMACTYRLREALNEGRMVTPADLAANPCDRLDHLGLQLARRAD